VLPNVVGHWVITSGLPASRAEGIHRRTGRGIARVRPHGVDVRSIGHSRNVVPRNCAPRLFVLEPSGSEVAVLITVGPLKLAPPLVERVSTCHNAPRPLPCCACGYIIQSLEDHIHVATRIGPTDAKKALRPGTFPATTGVDQSARHWSTS